MIQSLYFILYYCTGALASDILSLCIAARRGSLGPFSPSFDINRHLQDSLANNLPEDVHSIVSWKQPGLSFAPSYFRSAAGFIYH